ncbi:MAG: hypothetical protein FWD63_05660 [Propionibacteriaceae bacterium]|nr:hypothetical protein [Propionibacteriaceae bacterium]
MSNQPPGLNTITLTNDELRLIYSMVESVTAATDDSPISQMMIKIVLGPLRRNLQTAISNITETT